MPNQLSVPFKKTYDIQIRQVVREYILRNYTDTHPDAFRWDIGRWEALRKGITGGTVHVDRTHAYLSYHAHLVFILTKLPVDIGLRISFTPAFSFNAPPITLLNLQYERASVLFNLACLYSQLAAGEDRNTAQGLKQAIAFYQSSAGTWKYIGSSATRQLEASLSQEDMPLELSTAFVTSMEYLMLAQAQECVWQKACMDYYKNGLIAKLAAKVSSLYRTSLSILKEASPSVKHLLPSNWLPHLETKQLHFDAAAQYRKSVEDVESNRYGHEIARLTQAQMLVKKGHDIARRNGVMQPVLQDIKSLMDNVEKKLASAERDNDLIYHQDVPAVSALPAVQEVTMAHSVVPPALNDPKTFIGDEPVVFGELLGWGAKRAIDIYYDRRQNWLKDEVTDKAQQLNDSATKLLESLSLPAALEALERPIGLPPSLLKKAEEVQSEEGPTRVEGSIEHVQKLAQQDTAILEEVMDILDQEVEEDDEFQADHPGERPPSHEANREPIAKAERYRNILHQAADSDALVRQKWDEWEQSIIQLTWDEEQLEASVPSSTISFSPSVGVTPTQTHARALRVLLESLDDLMRTRDDLVRRATRLAQSDDITPHILLTATAVERWVEVQPSMFEDVLDMEMAKYDKFRAGIEETAPKQEALLASIQERNELFLQSRTDDTSVKEREHSLQSLDLAYHKYKEITRNLDEGTKFYNEFAVVLSQFRDTCKEWAAARQREMTVLTHSLQAMSLQSPPPVPTSTVTQQSPSPVHAEIPASPQRELQPPPGIMLNLPPPDSDEWETMSMPPAPTPMRTPKPRAAKKTR